MKLKKPRVLVPVFTMLAMFGQQIVRADTSVATATVINPFMFAVYDVTTTDGVTTLPWVDASSYHTLTFTNTGSTDDSHYLFAECTLTHYTYQLVYVAGTFTARANTSTVWTRTLYDSGQFPVGEYYTTAESTMTVNGLGSDATDWTLWDVVNGPGLAAGAGPGCKTKSSPKARIARRPVAKSHSKS